MNKNSSNENNLKSIIKTKNSQINQYYIISEVISKSIIDKIITNAMIISKTNKIEQKINNYYFNYIINLISPIISIHFFNYEKSNNNDTNQNINYSDIKIKSRTDTWIEIIEPDPSTPDRSESNRIIIDYYKKKNQKNNLIKIKGNQISNQINEIVEFNKINSVEKINNKKIKIEKILKINKKIEKIENIINMKKILKKDIPLMKCIDLEKEKYENKFNNEELNELLRKQNLEQNIELNQNVINKKEENKKEIKSRNIDGNILTFDSNGKVLKKVIKIDNILKKDFHFIDTKINKTKLLNQNINNLKKKKIINENNTFDKKNIIIEYNDNNKDENDDIVSEDILTNNKIKKTSMGKNNYSNINPEIGVVIKSEEDSYIKEGGNNFLLKYNKLSFNDFNELLYKTSLLNNKNLSSHNISEKKNISDINLTSYNSNNNNISNQTNNYEYSGYNQVLSEKNNPLIANAYSPILKNIKQIYNNKINKRNLTYSKYGKNIKKSNSTFGSNKDFFNLNEMSSLNSIKLSKITKNKSLYNIINDSDNINSIKNFMVNSENNNKIINNNNKNILSYNVINSYKDKIFPLIKRINRNTENKNKNNIINQFNYKILTNKNWGKEIESKETNYSPSNLIKNYFRRHNIKNKNEIMNRNRLNKIISKKGFINNNLNNSLGSFKNNKNNKSMI